MQRREHKTARLRCLQSDAHRFRLTKLTDKNHVGILAQSVMKPRRKRSEIPAERTLTDEAALRQKFILDGIFKRDDMRGTTHIHLLDQSGERR